MFIAFHCKCKQSVCYLSRTASVNKQNTSFYNFLITTTREYDNNQDLIQRQILQFHTKPLDLTQNSRHLWIFFRNIKPSTVFRCMGNEQVEYFGKCIDSRSKQQRIFDGMIRFERLLSHSPRER